MGSAWRAARAWLGALLERADAAGMGWYQRAALATAAVNPAAAVLLGGMALNQLLLVALNRTTLEAEETRYDVGPLTTPYNPLQPLTTPYNAWRPVTSRDLP